MDMASENGYIIFAPKELNSGVRGWYIGTLPTSRQTPIELEYLANERSVWKIEMEEGLELESAPFTETITAPFGSLTISLSSEGNIVTLSRSIEFTKRTIPTGEYAKFREFINT